MWREYERQNVLEIMCLPESVCDIAVGDTLPESVSSTLSL